MQLSTHVACCFAANRTLCIDCFERVRRWWSPVGSYQIRNTCKTRCCRGIEIEKEFQQREYASLSLEFGVSQGDVLQINENSWMLFRCFLPVLEVSSSSYSGIASTGLPAAVFPEVSSVMIIAILPGAWFWKFESIFSPVGSGKYWPDWANISPTTPSKMKWKRKNRVMNFLIKARTYTNSKLLSNN